MRVLKINGQLADIDSQTAIGITFQVFDVANPNTSRVNVSNAFTLPKTARNNAIFGFAGSVFNRSTALYTRHKVEYWVENVKYITDATARITKIGDRYELFVFDKPQELDTLRLAKWSDFVPLLFDWLLDNNYLYGGISGTEDWTKFVTEYTGTTEGVVLHTFLTSLTDVQKTNIPDAQVPPGKCDDQTRMCLFYRKSNTPTLVGQRYGVFVKTIFEAIRDIYGVDFFEEPAMGNGLWTDPYALGMYLHTPWLCVRGIATTVINLRFDMVNGIDLALMPENTELGNAPDKTVWGFISAFFQHFGAIIRPVGASTYSVQRYSDIITNALQDFSNNLVEGYELSPQIENFGQRTTIGFASVYQGGPKTLNSKTIVSNNEGLEAEKTLFEIDAHIPKLIRTDNSFINGDPTIDVLYRLEMDSVNQFTFFIASAETRTMDVWFRYEKDNGDFFQAITNDTFKIAAQYEIASEYTALDQLAEYPEVWTIRKWLTTTELNSIDLMARQSVWQLGGSFFINKIEGFNPEGSQQPVTVELIKVDNEVIVPYRPELGNYWVDFYGNIFTDNENNYFVW